MGNTIPVKVQWTENGKTESRTLHLQKGAVIDHKSGQFTASQANSVLTLGKEEAYILLGASHANPDQEKYKFDKNDMDVLKTEWYHSKSSSEGQLQTHTAVRSGYGAGHIDLAKISGDGKYVVNYTNGKNSGEISIFLK